jgi:hypothetical protein
VLVPIAVVDPLLALSLARTALSDPAALPPNSEFDPDLSMAGESADPAQVAYAIAQIDHAIGGLYFEPFDDPAREAGVMLAGLDRLLSSVAEGLDECGCFEGPVAKIREAVEHLAGARLLLASARS